jgi:hypothetical protein
MSSSSSLLLLLLLSDSGSDSDSDGAFSRVASGCIFAAVIACIRRRC